MKVKIYLDLLIGLLLGSAFLWGGTSALAADGEDPGFKLFKQNKCTKCHTLKKMGITTVAKSKDADEEGEDKEDNDKAPDLGKIERTLKFKGALSSEEFLKKFLKKEISMDKKKHKKHFKGSPKDLETIIQFIIKNAEPAKSGA